MPSRALRAATCGGASAASRARLLRGLEKQIRGELGRSEAKAAVAVTASNILLSVLVAGGLLAHVPTLVTLVGIAAGAADAAAMIVALSAAISRLRRTSGWLSLAGLGGPAVLDCLHRVTLVDHAEHVGHLARLARTKFALVRVALWLLISAVALVVVAGGVLAGGRV